MIATRQNRSVGRGLAPAVLTENKQLSHTKAGGETPPLQGYIIIRRGGVSPPESKRILLNKQLACHSSAQNEIQWFYSIVFFSHRRSLGRSVLTKRI